MKSILLFSFVLFSAALAIPVSHHEPSITPKTKEEAELAHKALFSPKLYNGDILKKKDWGGRNAVSDPEWRWPNGIIPYYIDPALNSQKQMILNAMNQFNSFTCVKFRPRLPEDKDFVRIFKGTSCYSTIGRDENYPEQISLGDGCYYTGTIVHELMHTVGFYHLHTRSDRDNFLKIYPENIDPKYTSEFAKLHPDDNKILVPFDYNSVMLYGKTAFSLNNKMTMEPTYSGFSMIPVFDKPGLTQVDANNINLLYECQ